MRLVTMHKCKKNAVDFNIIVPIEIIRRPSFNLLNNFYYKNAVLNS